MQNKKRDAFFCVSMLTGGRWDSNPRPTEPQSGTLTN